MTDRSELQAKRERLRGRIEQLHASGEVLEGDLKERWNDLNSQVEEIDVQLRQREVRENRILELARDPRNIGAEPAVPRRIREDENVAPMVRTAHDGALRTLDAHARSRPPIPSRWREAVENRRPSSSITSGSWPVRRGLRMGPAPRFRSNR
jgi:hypothetical protein